jgi:hypothetical protein
MDNNERLYDSVYPCLQAVGRREARTNQSGMKTFQWILSDSEKVFTSDRKPVKLQVPVPYEYPLYML